MEATATLTIATKGAQELLAELRAARAELEGLQGGGGGTSASTAQVSPSAGSPAATNAVPPSPSAPPTVVSQAASAAGTPAATVTVAGGFAGGHVALIQQAHSSAPPTASSLGYGNMYGAWTQGGFHDLQFDVSAGRWYDPFDKAYMLGGTNPFNGLPIGGGTPASKSSSSSSPQAQQEGFGRLALDMFAGWQMQMVAMQLASGYGQSVASGRPFHVESLIPSALTLGLSAAGAAIGGPAGMAIGGTIGVVASSALEPIIQQGIESDRIAKLYTAAGYGDLVGMNGQAAGVAGAAMMSGKPLPPGWVRDVQGRYVNDFWKNLFLHPSPIVDWASEKITGKRWSDSEIYRNLTGHYEGGLADPEFTKEALQSLNTIGWNPSVVRQLGAPDVQSGMSHDRALRMIDAAMWADPGGAYSAALELSTVAKGRNLADLRTRMKTALGVWQTKADLEGDQALAQAQMQYAGVELKMQGMEGAAGYAAAVRQGAAVLRAQAANDPDPKTRQAALLQASAMEAQIGPTIAGVHLGETEANAGLATSRANRAFETSLYGGASSSSLPWSQLTGALSGNASMLEAHLAQYGAYMSPAERTQMRQQIEELRFQASEGVGRRREEMRNSETIGETGLATARRMSGRAREFAFGSAEQQAGALDEELTSLQNKRRVLEEILQTSKYLTYEQRLQLQTSVEQTKQLEVQAQAQAVVGRADARRSTVMTSNAEISSGASIALIRGAGGEAGGRALLTSYQATLGNIEAQRGYIQDLLAGGYDWNSKEVQEARSGLADMQVQAAQQHRSMATLPESGAVSAERSALELQGAVYSSGLGGSEGAVRGNLLRQIQLNTQRVRDLRRWRDRMQSAGQWDEGMEEDFASQMKSVGMSTIGLVERYQNGWDQRLLSMAYNMPAGSAPYLFARFTHREAAMAGIDLAAFGGTEEQTRRARMLPARLIGMMGMDSPEGFAERGLAGATGGQARVRIDLSEDARRLFRVLDAGPNVDLRQNAGTINGYRTASQVDGNTSAQRRAPG